MNEAIPQYVPPLITLLVTIIGWYFIWYQQKKLLKLQSEAKIENEFRDELREKVSKVHAHLDDFAKLISLWRLKSGFSFIAVKDENGDPIPIGGNKIKVGEKYFYSNEDDIEALRQMNGTTIESLIQQTKLTISMAESEINDILAEIDSTNKLNQKMEELWIQSVYMIDKLYKNSNNWNIDTPIYFSSQMKEATTIRRDLRSQLDKAVREKIKKH
jgi:hypothetical protein